jgi:hypothetical protein
MNRRRVAVVAAVAALIAVGARQPTADIHILTHDARDLQPAKMRAAIDLGLVGIDLLVTWTRQLR